jgi:hypothetical protein
MSDDDTTKETEEHSVQEADDGLPDIDSDQQADLDGLDLSGADLDLNDSDDGEGADSDRDDAEGDTSDSASRSRSTSPTGEYGEMYVAALTSTTNAIVEMHGDGHSVDEDHFRALDLDGHFNDVMAKYAGGSDMPPERALVIGTLVAVGGPVALHTDLLTDAASQVRAQADGGEA